MVVSLKHTSISINDVIAASLRLEASVFNLESRKAKDLLNACKWNIKSVCGVDGIASSFHRGRFKRIYVEKSNIPIFQPSQILEIYPKPYKFISELTETDIDALRVQEGQILMSCSGTIGKCSIVTKALSNQVFSHDLLRIVLKNKIDIGYLYAYLISEIGQIIILTNNYGAVIQHIEPEHLNNVQIPYADDSLREKIHNLIIKSFDLRDQSNKLIDEAEKLLIAELKLPPIDELKPEYFNKTSSVKTFQVPLDSLNNRFDSSYHKPITTKILDYLFDAGASIKRLDNKELTNKIIQGARFTRNYVESDYGTVFLGGKQILELDPNNKKYLSTHTHGQQVIDDLFIKENMIAITRSGTIGKVQFVPKHWDNWAMSEHVLRVVAANNEIAGYLYIWLQSNYGKEFITRLTYGAVVDEIEEVHLAEVPIPILKNKKVIEQINNLALKANKLRAEAYYKEQEAIKIMNEEVIYATK